MTMADENTALIAASGASGVTLYSFDLTTYTIATLYTLEGVTDLVGLDLLENVRPDLITEEPAETGTMVHAYVKTESGYAWVKMDPATGACEVIQEGDTAYTGAGLGNDGMIYAYADGKYVQIDPANGYAVTEGAADAYNVPINDATGSAQEQVVSLIDEKSLTAVDVTVGGYLHYVSLDNWNLPYLVKLFDYTVPTAERKSPYIFDDKGVEAIAYQSCELLTDHTYFYEHYLVINSDGDLYKLTEKTKVYDGTRGWRRSAELLADLNLDVSGGASMTMADENTALIAASGASGVTLYSFDLTTNTISTLCTLDGVTDLVGLELLDKVQPAQTAQEKVLPNGKLMSVANTGSTSRAVTVPEAVVIADGTVKFDLVETENVTNGKLVVNFDASVLTFQECTSASVLFSVNSSEAAEGKLVIAYASGSAVAAGDVLASLTFTYDGDVIDTEALISTEQRNAEDAVSEEETVVEISNAVQNVAYNTATQTGYATVQEALAAAQAGQTIVLLTDAEEASVQVTPGVTLDLNGHELTVSFAVAFNSGHIVDAVGSGRLVAAMDHVVLDEENAMVPVYDGEGYIFTKVGFAIRQDKSWTEGFKINAMAYPVNMDVVELLKNGGADNNVRIMIQLTWDTDAGTGSQQFAFSDEVVSQVYSSNNGKSWTGYSKMFSMVVTGFENIENLTARIAVVSGTDVEYISTTAVDIT